MNEQTSPSHISFLEKDILIIHSSNFDLYCTIHAWPTFHFYLGSVDYLHIKIERVLRNSCFSLQLV